MDHDDLRDWSKRAADWAHDYHSNLRDQPVRSRAARGDIAAALPSKAPDLPEPMEDIFADFERIIPGGLSHWQHPRFFAYFPANAAPASMLAEQLINTTATQAMLWQTSPAATEVEEVMIQWLAQALGLGDGCKGTLHDTASTGTLSAVLSMRERALEFDGLVNGLSGHLPLRLYASGQTHSSIDKAARLAGIGQANLVKIPVDETLAMREDALDAAIRSDLEAGTCPVGVVICVGGTSVGASDRVGPVIDVAKSHGLPVHVDAAWAGSAMICPEFRHIWKGVERADSITFNPAKWLGAQFDCSVQFLRDPTDQIRTMGLRPDYLKSANDDEIVNFNEWTVPLGRRFRALKLWFVLRAYGLEGLRERIRNHVAWSEELCEVLRAMPEVEIVTEPRLSLFSFALESDDATQELLERINDDGRVYLTQTTHEGRYVIRMQVGQFDCTREDVMCVAEVVQELK